MQVHLAELLQRPLRRRLLPVSGAPRAEERTAAAIAPPQVWSRVEVPKSDAAAWEDTEIDVRRLVL